MRVLERTVEYLRMIRFSHSVFALPFAFASALLACKDSVLTFSKIAWISIAMISARSAAMGFNRFVDRSYDRKNPRTSSRAIPAGRISLLAVKIFIAVSLAIFTFAAGMLNPLALELVPAAVIITFGYSFAKRYTILSHFILGLSLGIAPVGAWIGIQGKIALLPIVISLGVMFWVAGFDIIYSILDIQIDRRDRLKSIPAALGISKALLIAKISHLSAFIIFIYVYIKSTNLAVSIIALLIILMMLLYQHLLLKPEDPQSIDRAFFIGNSVIGMIFFTGIFISYLFFR